MKNISLFLIQEVVGLALYLLSRPPAFEWIRWVDSTPLPLPGPFMFVLGGGGGRGGEGAGLCTVGDQTIWRVGQPAISQGDGQVSGAFQVSGKITRDGI